MASLLRLVVIYLRFSSELQRKESCDDQEREVRKRLERLGVDHRDAIVLRDEAKSGIRDDRAGFMALKAKIALGEVAVLAVDDLSRLTRGADPLGLIQDVVYFDGRFVSVNDNIDTIEDGWQLQVQVKGIANSATNRDHGKRVHRGHVGRVLDGNGSAGDYGFGFRSEPVDPDWLDHGTYGLKPKMEVKIHDEQAEWVRRIFHWLVVCFWSIGEITRELNRLKVPKGRRSTKPGWYHEQVRQLLGNPKYIGKWAYGKSTTVRDGSGNKKKQVPAANGDVVEVNRPGLQIIDNETWRRAQKRLAELKAKFGKQAWQKARGAKVHHTAVYPSSLLGGLLLCGSCGARLVYHGCGGNVYYSCTRHRAGECGQATQVPRERAEKGLLDFVGGVLTSTPEWLDRAWASLEQNLKALNDRLPAELETKQKVHDKLTRKIDNLTEAIEDNPGKSASLVQRLEARERELELLDADIAAAKKLKGCDLSVPDKSWMHERLRDLAEVLKKDERRAALFLRKVLGEVHAHAVIPPGKRRGYIRLTFRIDGWELAKHILERAQTLPSVALEMLNAGGHMSPEVRINVGGPSRTDEWAPKIVEMRKRKPPMRWKEIGRITGLRPDNACTAWKRYVEATKLQPDGGKNEDGQEQGAATA